MLHPQLDTLKPEETLVALHDYGYYFAPYIVLAHFFNAPKGWVLLPRVLSHYHFQYVIDGNAEYWIEGKKYDTQRGDLLFHEPYQAHKIMPIENKYVCISLTFHFGTLHIPLLNMWGGNNYLGNFVDHPIVNHLTNLVSTYHEPGLPQQWRCQRNLLDLFIDLSNRMSTHSSPKQNNATIVLIRNYLHEHAADPIIHADLESISGWSRNYIIIQFKKAFGVTPFEYLTWIRMDQAKKLAVQTSLSINEIARHVGYADVHTFGRTFKKETGTSLSQFRASVVVN